MKTIAIMQPYFAPYAGYFRLVASADIFVVYDCVQFPRRGWVHRNQMDDINGKLAWLGLPLSKQTRDTVIKDLVFAHNAQEEWNQRLANFEHLRHRESIWKKYQTLHSHPVSYITDVLQYTCNLLGFDTEFINSSDLNIDSKYKGQYRIIEIVKFLGGGRYINAPGGIELYEKELFQQQGIELQFLTSYEGVYTSILQRLQCEDINALSHEILRNCKFQ